MYEGTKKKVGGEREKGRKGEGEEMTKERKRGERKIESGKEKKRKSGERKEEREKRGEINRGVRKKEQRKKERGVKKKERGVKKRETVEKERKRERKKGRKKEEIYYVRTKPGEFQCNVAIEKNKVIGRKKVKNIPTIRHKKRKIVIIQLEAEKGNEEELEANGNKI